MYLVCTTFDQPTQGAAMNEVDDRLAGDPVWELFPYRAAGSPQSPRRARYGRWLAVVCLVAAVWLVSPALAVLVACVAMAAGDFRYGWHIARSIPDKAGGAICARFTYAWGVWKLSMTAFVFLFLAAGIAAKKSSEMPPASMVSLLLCVGGWLLSAGLTASGLVRAYRSGMRVWVGEGVNQARTLLLGMLIVGFAVFVLGPMGTWLAVIAPRARDSNDVIRVSTTVGVTFGLMLIGAVVILVVLDWLSHHVVADRPGKFGPKVPTVGKWGS
jgi:hypothetical protein